MASTDTKHAYAYGMLKAGIEHTIDCLQRDVTYQMPSLVNYLKDLVVRADAASAGHPQCSICRDHHPNDDRHPCE